MTRWVRGIDSSFDELTLDEARRLKAAGVAIYIQCLWTGAQQPGPRVTSLRNADRAGLLLAGYISVTGARSGTYHADMGRDGVPDDLWRKLLLVPVDVELDGIPNRTIRDCVERVKVLAPHLTAPQDRSIYTSWNAWVNKQGNPKDFTDCLLWNANWDGDPDRDFERLSFGGWRPEQVVVEQWSGGVYIEGQYADRDEVNLDLLLPAPPPAPAPPGDPCGLVALRVSILEAGIKAALANDGQALVNLGRFLGGKCS